ncbi:VWA domain-containing protein [Pseudomonas putida]|uniref:VWFA domain-containing protein n=1 Tax=Pseudomonas putida TaxID=303 RepID=A0A1Q9QX24_PSEPU|nr:VWA domain-containing protein [Pseudomonas putida]OLS59714.1 hypothetical protein PSEMO_56850 [Pseudomonas putida]
MDIELDALHFLRPAWLWLLLPASLLALFWRRQQHQRLHSVRIAPHLLRYLRLDGQQARGVKPVHLACALLVLGALAMAGPTWQQDRPNFLDDRASMLLALDLSASMDSADIPPSRLEAARHKLHSLIERRRGAATGLIAYAGSAHLVMPATRDPALLDSYLQALSSSLIQRPGKDVAGVLEVSRQLLAADNAPATLVLVTDGADSSQFTTLKVPPSLQVLILAVGSADGQPGGLDTRALEGLGKALDAPLGSLTANDDDLDWVEAHARQHFQAAPADGAALHWKDAGYWLCWPLLLIAFFCVRRGWSLNWSAALLLGLLLNAPDSRASALVDAFLTPDQQGRRAFEQHHYPAAARDFQDLYWKGIAAYNAADYDLALSSFARLRTAPAYFYIGNIQARRFKFDPAIAAYRQALALQADFPEARDNLALVLALQKDAESAAANAPEVKADQIAFDKPAGKGASKDVQTPQATSDALWLDNLSTSPAQFLQRKFALQDATAKEGQ